MYCTYVIKLRTYNTFIWMVKFDIIIRPRW